MTYEETLRAMITMWQKLASNGNAYKPDTAYVHNCPCCEHVFRKYFPDTKVTQQMTIDMLSLKTEITKTAYECACIDDCPLKSLWPNGCLDNETPYAIWDGNYYNDDEYDIRVRKEQAQIIANEAKRLLKELT